VLPIRGTPYLRRSVTVDPSMVPNKVSRWRSRLHCRTWSSATPFARNTLRLSSLRVTLAEPSQTMFPDDLDRVSLKSRISGPLLTTSSPVEPGVTDTQVPSDQLPQEVMRRRSPAQAEVHRRNVLFALPVSMFMHHPLL